MSHHPPVSVCHADSQNFIFKQDCRAKTKFWGKSIEVQPIGSLSVYLPAFNEEYTWKKVTTCVHNILGGQRWVDQYGEMVIQCKGIKCRLNFIKVMNWISEMLGNINAFASQWSRMSWELSEICRVVFSSGVILDIFHIGICIAMVISNWPLQTQMLW